MTDLKRENEANIRYNELTSAPSTADLTRKCWDTIARHQKLVSDVLEAADIAYDRRGDIDSEGRLWYAVRALQEWRKRQ